MQPDRRAVSHVSNRANAATNSSEGCPLMSILSLRRITAAVVVACSAAVAVAAPAAASTGGITLGQAHVYAMGGHNTVTTINATGSASPLVKLPADGYDAIVSPDGRWVAYDRVNRRLRDAHGRHRQPAPGRSATDGCSPGHLTLVRCCWSSPGQPIDHRARGRPRLQGAGEGQRHRHLLRDLLAGRSQRPGVSNRNGWRLLRTSTGAQREFVKAPCAEPFDLTWSPDGRRVAMACNANFRPGPRIAVLTIATGRVQRLGDRWTGSSPVWLTSSSLLIEQGAPHKSAHLNTYDLSGPADRDAGAAARRSSCCAGVLTCRPGGGGLSAPLGWVGEPPPP